MAVPFPLLVALALLTTVAAALAIPESVINALMDLFTIGGITIGQAIADELTS